MRSLVAEHLAGFIACREDSRQESDPQRTGSPRRVRFPSSPPSGGHRHGREMAPHADMEDLCILPSDDQIGAVGRISCHS